MTTFNSLKSRQQRSEVHKALRSEGREGPHPLFAVSAEAAGVGPKPPHWPQRGSGAERRAKEVGGVLFHLSANATDHCHRTGKYRSNLCRRCNLVLGFVKDDAALLGRMIAYLKRHHRDEGMSEEAIEILERVIERHENGEDGEWNL